MPPSDALRRVQDLGRGVVDRLGRLALGRMAPTLDNEATEGGRGEHPLGAPLVPWWAGDAPSFDVLGGAALRAGADPDGSLVVLATWLHADRPGQGDAWSGVAVVARRVVHLAALWAWTQPELPLAQHLAGSARAHLIWLAQEVPLERDLAARVLGQAARVIGGLSWPALDVAREAWSSGAAGLRRDVPAMMDADDVRRPELTTLAEALWAVALARAWGDRNHVATASEVDGALIAGADLLWRVGGETGGLPHQAQPHLLPLSATPLPHTLHNLVLAWELDRGVPASTGDNSCLRLAGRIPAGTPEPFAIDDWCQWSWRAAGICVGHANIVGRRGRALMDARRAQVTWDVDGFDVVEGHRSSARLDQARTDGPKLRARMILDESKPDVPASRDALFRQQRLVVEDEGATELRWTVPAAWGLCPDDGGFAGTRGGLRLVVQLDPSWTWTLETGATSTDICGRGPATPAVRSSFEVVAPGKGRPAPSDD
jgi:hypothetical protein